MFHKFVSYVFCFLDPPTVTKDPANGLKKVFKGDTVTMSCYGEGRPKPTVKWHRLVIKYLKLNIL